MSTTPVLNAYSQRFANVLFAAFPAWEVFAINILPEAFPTASESDVESDGGLLVRVPCPAPSSWPPTHNWLLIDTTDDQILINWDGFHAHFDMFSGIPEEKGFMDALTFLKELVEEKFCIAVAKEDEEWRGAMVIRPGEKPAFAYGGKAYVRSWRGTYDVQPGD